jgi:NAD-dependent aldehyde dehydrogenases
MHPALIQQKLQRLRQHFDGGNTLSYAFRKQQLQQLKKVLLKYEKPLYDALYADLKKSREESWVTEIGFVIAEIKQALKNLHYWMQPQKVKTNLLNLPSSSYIVYEPLGVVLIISPWNYPLQLLFAPLVGALAAGNCVVLKPSELAPATTRVMSELIKEVFSEDHVLYVEGEGATVVPAMMQHFSFDHVFYTGSTVTGKQIYRMAAERMVPVTLELGGKSPCVVEKDANVKIAAKRIAVTKFSNAGQMCIAPDYILVHKSRKEELIKALIKCIQSFYSNDPATSYNYGKIINEKHFNRLVSYLQQGVILHGGRHDSSRLYIEPTIMDNVPPDAPLMKEEIFGPILPIISFSTMEEAKSIIQNNPDPLAFYIYTNNAKTEEAWIQAVSFGGGCINNSSWHFTNYHLPFGGRRSSGMGRYHGRYSFDTFSHIKSVMKTPGWFDPSLRYPPFKGKLKLFKWLIR